jgi:hypothetical protein
MRFKSVAEFLALEGEDVPTTAELKLIDATKAGEPCILFDGKPSRPTEASDNTVVRAQLLRLLITGGTAECGLHERGVTLVGGWIEGELDVSFCAARGRTALNYCVFMDTPNFDQSRLVLLDLSNSQLPGLLAQGVRTTGSFVLIGTVSTAPMDLTGAQIGQQLAFFDAKLSGNGGKSLYAQGLSTREGLVLRNVTSFGTVDLNAAQIGGQLDCSGAVFNGRGDKALNVQGAKIAEGFLLKGITAIGTVDLNAAQIGGQVDCSNATLDGRGGKALNAQNLLVSQAFILRNLKQVKGLVTLTAAHVGSLVDDSAGWLAEGNALNLNGFTYDILAGTAPLALTSRRHWLEIGSHWDGEFRPQPYAQFARVLRQMGHPSEARNVLMERTSLQAKATRASREIVPNGDVSVGFRSLWADILNIFHWISDWIAFLVAGYGHAPVRSLWCLIGLFFAATALAHFAWKEGSFAPNSDVILASPGWAEVTAQDCFPTSVDGCELNPADVWSSTFTTSATTPTQGADWDSFNALGYAADLVVPFLDLGQTDAWAPSKDRGFWGWVLWWARWVLAALGWVVTGLGVAAVTGVMQRNQSD